MIVPNKFPSIRIAKRIALIGEAPGADEERLGIPFVGASGRFLSALLARSGVSKDACFVGNISQHRPPDNKIVAFAWNGLQIQHGLDQLRKDIEAFNPNVCVLLGNTALKAAMDVTTDHPLIPRAFKFKNADWRGSIIVPDNAASPFYKRKCIPSYHPAYCLRDYSCTPLLEFDLRRAVGESLTPEHHPRPRRVIVPASADEACAEMLRIRNARLLTGTDIEGYWNGLTCIAFANDPLCALVIPFVRRNGTRYWPEHEEPLIWRAVAELLEDPDLPKVLQNGLYDRFALGYGHGIRVRNCAEDTMLKWWELYAELPKALDVQTSILVPDVPYYKGTSKTTDDATYFLYNGMDAMVTLEIAQTLDHVNHRDMPECAKEHYRFNNAILNPLLYMEQRGMLYDSLGAELRRDQLRDKLHEAQARLNGLTGRWCKSVDEMWSIARSRMGFVRASIAPRDFAGIAANALKASREDAERLAVLMSEPCPTLATLGEIENLIGVSLNLSSDDQTIPFLYEELKLPTQTKKSKDAHGNEVVHPTADYEALLKLSKLLQREGDATRLAIVHLAIEIRALETRQRMLGIQADPDGRIRCGYNVVGSETGRIQCYTSPTGSGYNLQTIPDYSNPADAPGGITGDRDLFVADPGYWFFECDLKGADGWTVAAYAAMLGDPTMLNDYKNGIAPFDILTLKLRGITGDYASYDWLREARKQVKKTDWDRFAMKRVQHGGCYLEGALVMSNNILKDSEGKCFIEPSECLRIRDGIFFARYPGVRRWHGWVQSRLRERPELTAASGQVRKFFGRPDEILTSAIAYEPQTNTTHAVKLALYRLWTDPENRVAYGGSVSLIVQPLHTVHDSLCGQFRKDDTPWAVGKIRDWFNNPLTIAGQSITIPFDGAYGTAWGNKTEGKI